MFVRLPSKHFRVAPTLWIIAGIVFATLVSCTGRGGVVYFVAPGGSDDRPGMEIDLPLSTIQLALDRAKPGDVIRLSPGDYAQDFETSRAGGPNAPIRILGTTDASGRRSVIKGAGAPHIIDVRHSHIWIEDLAVNGLFGRATSVDGYRSKLIYVKGGATTKEGLVGVRLLRLSLRNAGTECVRLKYGVSRSEVAESLFENCGVWDFQFGRGQKNGEALYIGTAPEQLPSGYAPGRDPSRENWIHGNWFRTNGAECIDVKEGASENLIEGNDCSGQKDANSGGISIRGPRNIVRRNRVHDNLGAGIRLGGDEPTDAIENVVVENEIFANEVAGIKMMSSPQAKVCGNRIWNQDPIVRGPFAKGLDPSRKC